MFDEYAILRARAQELEDLGRRVSRRAARRTAGTRWIPATDRLRGVTRRAK